MQDCRVQKIFDPMLYLDAHYGHLREPQDECHLFETILVKLHDFLAKGQQCINIILDMGNTVDCCIVIT